jgi:hypothetical protein
MMSKLHLFNLTESAGQTEDAKESPIRPSLYQSAKKGSM